MRLSLDPTLPKVVIIAILIVTEGLLGSAYTVVNSGRMPTQIEWLSFIIVAWIQLLTFLITFLETGQAPKPNMNTSPEAGTVSQLFGLANNTMRQVVMLQTSYITS